MTLIVNSDDEDQFLKLLKDWKMNLMNAEEEEDEEIEEEEPELKIYRWKCRQRKPPW